MLKSFYLHRNAWGSFWWQLRIDFTIRSQETDDLCTLSERWIWADRCMTECLWFFVLFRLCSISGVVVQIQSMITWWDVFTSLDQKPYVWPNSLFLLMSWSWSEVFAPCQPQRAVWSFCWGCTGSYQISDHLFNMSQIQVKSFTLCMPHPSLVLGEEDLFAQNPWCELDVGWSFSRIHPKKLDKSRKWFCSLPWEDKALSWDSDGAQCTVDSCLLVLVSWKGYMVKDICCKKMSFDLMKNCAIILTWDSVMCTC
jgi:hypothetical protein